jgi:hypothetical protein
MTRKQATTRLKTATSVTALCAEYARTVKKAAEISNRAYDLYKQVIASMPPLDRSITQKELRQHPDFAMLSKQDRSGKWGWGGGHGIPPWLLEEAIRTLTEVHVVRTNDAEGFTLRYNNKPTPLSEEAQALLGRLQERLRLMEAWQAEFDRRLTATDSKACEVRSREIYHRAWTIVAKIARQRCRNFADLAAKYALYKSSHEQFRDEGHEDTISLIESIVHDAFVLTLNDRRLPGGPLSSPSRKTDLRGKRRKSASAA